eukprot:scaffold321018_cov28-Tisochrysis_lutea.AAC.3
MATNLALEQLVIAGHVALGREDGEALDGVKVGVDCIGSQEGPGANLPWAVSGGWQAGTRAGAQCAAAHLHRLRLVPHEEAGPLVHTPEPGEVVPREQDNHAVGALDKVLNARDVCGGDGVALWHACLVNPECDVRRQQSIVAARRGRSLSAEKSRPCRCCPRHPRRWRAAQVTDSRPSRSAGWPSGIGPPQSSSGPAGGAREGRRGCFGRQGKTGGR